MIKGIGVDAVEIARIQNSLCIPGFLNTTFTKNEIANEHGNKAEYYAGRFAGKEAVFKALHKTIDWRNIEILNYEDGRPYVLMDYKGNIHISITTESGMAIAYCVIEE